jgi:PmbA protein
MQADLGASAASAVEMAKAAGAQEAWASTSRSRNVEFAVRDGQLEKVQESTAQSLSIRLWVDGRYSAHSTTDLRPETLRSFLADAVALTRALEPDPYRVVPDPALFAGRPTDDLDLVDPAVDALTREVRLAACQEMNARVAGKPGVISATSWMSDGRSEGAAASSNGFAGGWGNTSVWWGTEVTVRDEGDKRPEGHMYGGALHLGDVTARDRVADEALTRANAFLGAKKGPSVRTTMIVEPMAAARLINALLGPANGGSVQQKRSFWAGKVGQKLVSEKLRITDEPLRKRGLASRHFDGDGISAKPMPLVADGALQNLYLDVYYAKKLGLAPTTGGPSNRVVGTGDRDLAAILGGVGKGVLVTSWLGGNNDATTGDFSFGIRGHLVENGKVGAPVGEMNVTGNLVELFSRVAEVGNDPWKSSSVLVPTLVFENVQFSGA